MLFEIEIYNNDNKLITKMDSYMLNKFLPKNYLGYELIDGIYYYSFASEPLNNFITGGIDGNKHYIIVKTLKDFDGVINMYVNNYQKICL